ncbi:hypothetical protein ABPG74_013374 [Tetrahymena malaccensis]
MKCSELWTEIIPKNDPNSNITNQVWSCSFNNDGSILLACVGDAILVYDSFTGNLVNKAIRGGQKEQINCIKFSKDGKRFATASNDKTVWVWSFDVNKNPKLAPEVKYSHTDKVLCLAFNPLTHQIFSGGAQDYALWTPDQQSIEKSKFKDKIISCAWSWDGLYLGFGTMGGIIGIRNRALEQLAEIQRSFPIWCMDWTPITPDYQNSVLVVGVWEQSIAHYNIQGQQLGSDKKLTYDPIDINFSTQGEFLLVSGTNNKCTLYTREGGFLIDVVTKNDWIWSNKLKPTIKEAGSVAVQDQLHVALTTNDGEISMFKIQQLTVHALEGDKYAYRDNLTDIVVQSMSSNQRIRLKCKELVKNISIYKDKLAAHLTERILIYGTSAEDNQMKYKLHKRIVKKVEAHILEIVSNHLIACVKNKVQLYQLSGDLEKEWIFDSRVNCIKIIGGMPNKEGAYVGLKNGQIFKIFVDNSFPIPILSHNISIKNIDASQKRKRIAVVDKNNNLTVYDLTNKEQVFQEMNIVSCAFNNNFDDLLAFSSNDTTFIRCANHPPLSQKITGQVVGFKANKLFVLNDSVMSTIDVSMTQTMIKYLERKEFQSAYDIALLGVTDQDFLYLGNEALIATQFAIARKCYTRIKKLDFIYLLEKAEKDFKKNTFIEGYYQGEIYALQSKLDEASNVLIRSNLSSQAKEMWITVKKFDKAMGITDSDASPINRGRDNKEINSDASRKDLLIQKAEWEVKQGNWKKGGELYIQAEIYKKAIEIYVTNNFSEGIVEVCRNADAETQRKEIEQCAAYFKKAKLHQYTKEAYLKLQDNKALLQLSIDLEKWDEAMTLAKAHPEFMEMVKLPYANWLAKQDRYEESLKAYRKIGKHDMATKMLYNLSQNAVYEKRFSDAALFTWMIATEHLGLIRNMKAPTPEDIDNLMKFYQYRDDAEIYFAYSKVQSFVDEPFLPLSGHAYMLNIFNAARFAINKLGNRQLYGVQHSYLYYSLGKVSKQLEGYKTARICYEKLASYKIPTEWSEEIELSTLLIRSKPYSDQESLLPICNRCYNQNPALTEGNKCSSCMHQFQNCFISFENLPLVEFKLDPKITHKRFIELINSDKSKTQPNKKKKKANDGWQESHQGDQQVLTFNNSPQKGGNDNESSPFLDKLTEVFEIQQTTQEYIPVTLDENIVSTLGIDEVYWVDYTKYCYTSEIKYYKSMLTDIPLKNCQECGTFYILDEYEFEISKTQKCPFCRSVDERAGPQKDVFDF